MAHHLTAARTRAVLRMTLTPAPKLVLLDLLGHADNGGLVVVSAREVAKRTNLTGRGVYKALDALEEAGLMARLRDPRAWQIDLTRTRDLVNRGEVAA